MKFKNLLLGFAGILPASVLLFSAREFALLSLDQNLGKCLEAALVVAFISAWSCYIVSISSLLKSKDVPTSLEGMFTYGFVGLGFGICLLVAQYLLMDVPFGWLSTPIVVAGCVASCALQGFYIGYSKARLINEGARAFIFRQIGLFVSTLVLAAHLLIAYRPDEAWVPGFFSILLIGTGAILYGLYVRASRQRKRYLSRRYKQRSDSVIAASY